MNRECRIRQAKIADLDRLAEIHAVAYPDARNLSSRLARFSRHPFGNGSLEAVRVAEVGKTIVGHAFLFDVRVSLGGRLVPAAAIATVGIAPEARGHGYASQLIEHLHEEARARGAAVSILHAFRHSFYERLGYVPVTPSVRARVAPEALPADRNVSLRAARKGDRKTIESIYARALPSHTGWLHRSTSMWNELFMNERLCFSLAIENGAACGYAAWSIEQEEPHAPSTVRVREIVAESPLVGRDLLSLFSRMRDQVSAVEFDLPIDSPWLHAFGDGAHPEHGTETLEHPIGQIAGGAMVHILDPSRALSLRGYPSRGTLSFTVGDSKTPWQISSRRDTAAITQKTGTKADLHLTEAGLALVLYGAMPLSHAEALGLAHCRSLSARQHADSFLRIPAYHSIDPF